jgi:hypothetical protein
MEECVSAVGVDLHAAVQWRGVGQSHFYHEEEVGEVHKYVHTGVVAVVAGGSWGVRTPILHPAVAAIDMTQAGVDDAYLRAMQNVDLMLGGGRRDDAAGAVRSLVTKYARAQYNPVRLMYRAAVLWAILAHKEVGGAEGQMTYRASGLSNVPRRLADLTAYSAFCGAQLREAHDVLFIKCGHGGEVYMLDVLQALCSRTCPVRTDITIGKLWPDMLSPVVAYTAPESLALLQGVFSLSELSDTMTRLCSQLDCFDLWQEALQTVQGLLCRPDNCGMLGGLNSVILSLPASDLRVGALGPLLAGVSAEGMRGSPFGMPTPKEYCYGAAVRGVFFCAAYYEAINRFKDSHPIVVAANSSDKLRYSVLANRDTGRTFMEINVRPIAKMAGWDVLTDGLAGLHLMPVHGYPTLTFCPNRVVWWTGALMHLGGIRESFIKAWALPARPTKNPTPNSWAHYSLIGAATSDQVGACLRWLGAKLQYSLVKLPGTIRVFPVAIGNKNRFLPGLDPVMHIGPKGTLHAVLHFPRDVNERLAFTEELGRSVVAVFRRYKNEVDLSEYMPTGQGSSAPHFTIMGAAAELDAAAEAERIADQATEAAHQASAAEPPSLSPVGQPTSPDPIDWEQVASRLGPHGLQLDPGTMRRVHSLPAGTHLLALDSQFQQAGLFNPRSIVDSVDPETACDDLHTYIVAMDRLLAHAPNERMQQHLFERRTEAASYIAHIMDEKATALEQPQASGSKVEEAAHAITEGLVAAAAEEASAPIVVVPDDPEGPIESPQDFGRATSPPAFTRADPLARLVAPPIEALPHIGFKPPSVLELSAVLEARSQNAAGPQSGPVTVEELSALRMQPGSTLHLPLEL